MTNNAENFRGREYFYPLYDLAGLNRDLLPIPEGQKAKAKPQVATGIVTAEGLAYPTYRGRIMEEGTLPHDGLTPRVIKIFGSHAKTTQKEYSFVIHEIKKDNPEENEIGKVIFNQMRRKTNKLPKKGLFIIHPNASQQRRLF